MTRALVAVVATAAVVGCGSGPRPPAQVGTGGADSAGDRTDDAQRLAAFFEDAFERRLARSPMLQTQLGLDTDYDKWDDFSDELARRDHEMDVADLARLRAEFDPAALDPQSRLSFQLFEYEAERRIAAFAWRFHRYPITQMGGMHTQIPVFLANYHRIDDRADAAAYLSRLERVPRVLAQVEAQLLARQERGVLPPAFVFPYAISDAENILSGAPFDAEPAAFDASAQPDASSKDSVILADFRRKIAALADVPDADKREMFARAAAALRDRVGPAYRQLIAVLKRQAAVATDDDGAWKLPDGAAFYAHALRWATTTDMGPDEIFSLGEREVARIHAEMRAIMAQVGATGPLQKFFGTMRTEPRFYYANDDAGRAAYLAEVQRVLDEMDARLGEVVGLRPESSLLVKRVEPYREKSAGKAFYNRPAPDGSRPGIYYANLYDMADMPKYQLAALAYHEAIPGHHLQNAIAGRLENLPKFRRFGGYSAYGEGWALYAERLPKEMGLYRDPYSDFGRLAMELWRACRLVVDVGIHHKRWPRARAIAYLSENTPNPPGDIVKAIERYIVWPGQATAYKVGMQEILALRERARQALGPEFDLREFHDTVLGSGPVPLSVLSQIVDAWIARADAARRRPTKAENPQVK